MAQMWKPRKGLLVSAGVAAAAILAALLLYGSVRHSATAHASAAPELFSALPPGAPTLVYLDLAAVRASSFYQHRPDKGPIAVPSPDYADFVRSTGFDFEKDLDRVAIASWPAQSGQEPRKNVVIADGRFDRAKIRDYALRKGKLDHQQGRDVFVFAGDQMKSQFESLTFLDDHRIAIVAGPSIAPLIAGPGGAGDPARERAARVDGAAMFVITRVPPIPDNLGGGGAQSAQLASLVRSVQWITLAARPEGDNVRVSLEGECDNDTDARQLQSALELLRMFGRAGLESPKTRASMDPAGLAVIQTLMTSAQVTQSAERVRVLVELTPDVLKLGQPSKGKAQ
jgi:hypothetical protein